MLSRVGGRIPPDSATLAASPRAAINRYKQDLEPPCLSSMGSADGPSDFGEAGLTIGCAHALNVLSPNGLSGHQRTDDSEDLTLAIGSRELIEAGG